MKFINKNFNVIVIILFIINIGLMLLLYNLGMNRINMAEGNLHNNHLGLNNKPLLNEMSDKINVLEQNLNNLKTTCDTKMNKVLISLCNINDYMALKPNRYPNQNVGEKNEESTFSRGCYNTIGVN
jgi:hypothetical protein